MKNKPKLDIILLIIITLLSIICVKFLPLTKYPLNFMTYFILAIFLPGYAIVGVIFPRKGRIGYYRVVLSISISLFISFILISSSYYNFFKLSIANTFIVIGIFTILMAIIALYRQYRSYEDLEESERPIEKLTSVVFLDNIEKELKHENNNNVKINEKKDNLKPYKKSSHSIKDLGIVLILTGVSLLVLFVPSNTSIILSFIKPVFIYLLIFLLSGYAFWAALVPKKQLVKINRLILVLIFGGILFATSYLTLRFNLFNGPSLNYAIILSLFTVLMCLIAGFRRSRTSKIPEKIEKHDYEADMDESSTPNLINIKESQEKIKETLVKEELSKTENNEKMSKKEKRGLKFLDLILVFLVTLTSLIVILTPNLTGPTIRTILIFLLLLFLPGYSLVAALYPKNDDLHIFERLALSFGFPLIGIALAIVLTTIFSVKISLDTILILLALFTLSIVLIAFIRRMRTFDEDKFYAYSKDKNTSKNVKTEFKESKTERIEELTAKTPKNILTPSNETDDTKKTSDNLQNSLKPRFVSKDLILIFVTTILAIIFIVAPKLNDTFIRTVLGLFLILFLPGYSLIAALFPKKEDLDGIERAALSFGLSIAVTPLIGLALNYTPWGIRLTPILISLSAFTIIMLIIAFIRRRRVPEGEKFFVNFGGFITSIKDHFKGESKTSKILSIILLLTIIIAITTTIFIIVKPKQGETFTEFYILGPGGKATDYPANLTVGQNASVIIGIVNHEYKTVNYELVVTSGGTVMSAQTVTLTDGNQTQIPYSFSENTTGNKEIQFSLYKLPDKNTIYRSLHLFVKVS